MAQPTNSVKVDDAVHSELERLKGEHDVSTFNAVLRHELDIVPDAKIDDLAAFLPEELREAAHDVVEVVESVNGFTRDVEEGEYGKTYLTFTSPNTERKIGQVGFDESEFTVSYLNKDGEMDQCGRGRKTSSNEIQYGTSSGTYDHIEPEEMMENVEDKVSGSNRRWGGG
jgi:hypothetical protein